MRDDSAPTRVIQPSHTKAAQRRRRLKRGVARWDFDRKLCAEPTRRIATVTLTVPERDPEAAIGRVREFWRKVRQQWLGTRYFCWLELQARGAVHYHCVWLNPPNYKRVNMQAWVARAWGEGRTQVRWSDGSAGLDRELDYALKYSDKMNRKAYQQRYDDVPSQLRTFMSQRLEIPPTEVDEHLDRDIWQYTPSSSYQGGLTEEHLELVGRVEHVVPIGGRCSALDKRRGKHRPRWDTPAPPLRSVPGRPA